MLTPSAATAFSILPASERTTSATACQSSGDTSKIFFEWTLGMTSVWPALTGRISRNATTRSSSYTLYDGNSPEAILQKMQSEDMDTVYNGPMSPLVRSLLEKRGVTSEADVQDFLEPDYDLHTHSPFLLAGMQTAVERVFAAFDRGERIAVYADFDCDGIPGAAVLSDFFEKLGYGNVEVYLPHRDREGYGFHTEAIETLAVREVKLIITVDVGTTAIDAVAFAKQKGIDVIVTDHHEIPGALPDAVAVLNPKFVPPASSGVERYPFSHLCGAAVAFKLVQALLEVGRKRELPAFSAVPSGWEKWLLDLVAIATVADMVPLLGENRVLAHWGLKVLRKSQRPGIAALCEKLRLRRSELTEDDIGFSFSARINAAPPNGE